ncbi:hypothetical protein BHE74_00046998, partial [Ensete ventricosum]
PRHLCLVRFCTLPGPRLPPSDRDPTSQTPRARPLRSPTGYRPSSFDDPSELVMSCSALSPMEYWQPSDPRFPFLLSLFT